MTKLCVNCKHYRQGAMKLDWCEHPKLGTDYVDGSVNAVLAQTQRKDFNRIETCGSNGDWFETKYPANQDKNNWTYITVEKPVPIKLTLWQKLKELFK